MKSTYIIIFMFTAVWLASLQACSNTDAKDGQATKTDSVATIRNQEKPLTSVRVFISLFNI